MFKKIILLLFISSLVVSGFAQKSKRKTSAQPPKSSYFAVLINGETTPKERYCPSDSIPILFDFAILDTNININDITYHWRDNYHHINIQDSTPINLIYLFPRKYEVYFDFEIPTDTGLFSERLTTIINVDYIRTILDTMVCQGRDISVVNSFGETLIYTNVQTHINNIPWDTLTSVSGCDSLVRWEITMNPYIEKHHKISSCDSVIWENMIIKRPLNHDGDYKTTVDSVFLAENPKEYCCDCDTLKFLTVTIIDTAKLVLTFDSIAFCAGDDMAGTIELETNFTAFDWRFNKHKYRVREQDSIFTIFEPGLEIEYSGHYEVLAYMDTSLYDTLINLRIVNNCYLTKYLLVSDCPLIIPNVITPNGDGANDVLGIKKLNPERENELAIYDRWGKNVFSKKGYKCVFKGSQYHNIEEAFEGLSRNGRKLPDGTYYYAFMYDAIPKKIKYTGTIVILRD